MKPSRRAFGSARLTLSVHAAGGGFDLGRAGKIERHAADVGFVDDVARADLQRHRRRDAGGGFAGGFGILHRLRARERNAVAGKQRRHLAGVEPFAPVGKALPHDRLRLGRSGLRACRDGGRRFQQQLLALAVAHQIHEGAHRAFRRLVVGHLRRHQVRAPLRHACLAHPAGEHVLLRRAAGEHAGQPLGGVERGGDRGRTIEHHRRIDILVIHHDGERLGVTRSIRVADDVDRIGVAPGRRQHGIELGDCLSAQRRKPPALLDQPVGRQDAGTAAIGDDGEPVAALRRAAGKRGGGVEQFLDLVDAQHAGAPERRFVDDVGARQRAGMRGGGARAFLGAAAFDHDHRLDPRGPPRRRHELARMRDGLGVDQDRLRRLVEREVIEQIAEIDVGHVAHGDDGREADAARQRPVDHRGRHGAGLREEGDVAGQDSGRREGGVEPDAGHGEPKTIGPDDAQQMRPRGGEQRGGALLADLGLAFGKSGGENDGGAGAAAGELADQRGNRIGRRRDDGEIRRQRQAGDIRIGHDAVHRGVVRINGDDRALEIGMQQIGHQRRADRMRLVGGADHRDRLRAEHLVEIADGHGLFLTHQVHSNLTYHNCSKSLAAPKSAGSGCVMT